MKRTVFRSGESGGGQVRTGGTVRRKDKGRLQQPEMMLTPNLTEPETDMSSRAREYTEDCLNVLLEIALSNEAPRSVRIRAAKMLSRYRALFARRWSPLGTDPKMW
jgi:hypothetical protein